MDRDVPPFETNGRRAFLRGVGVFAALTLLPARAAETPVRIGLTPVFLDDQMNFLSQWRHWLEVKLGRAVVFVQRGSYREVTDLIRSGKLVFGCFLVFRLVIECF
jgi:phosphonate transport system substrate-binding protein